MGMTRHAPNSGSTGKRRKWRKRRQEEEEEKRRRKALPSCPASLTKLASSGFNDRVCLRTKMKRALGRWLRD